MLIAHFLPLIRRKIGTINFRPRWGMWSLDALYWQGGKLQLPTEEGRRTSVDPKAINNCSMMKARESNRE